MARQKLRNVRSMVSKKSQLKQWLITVLKLIVAGSLIGWLVGSGRFDLNSLAKISSPTIWAFGMSLFFAVVTLNAYRWKLLLQLEGLNLSLAKSLRLSLIGIFFNFVMPGGVGGDLVKAGYLMRNYREQKWFIGWSILVDRILGMTALLLFSSITGIVFYQYLKPPLDVSFFTTSVLIAAGFISVVLVLVVSPKRKIESLLQAYPVTAKTLLPLFYFFHRPKSIVVPFLLSFVSQGLVIGLGVFLAVYLEMGFPIWMVLLVFPFGFLATILPISPAGIGVGQAAFYYLFEQVAGQGSFGVLVITFFQAVQFLIGLVGGLLFVLYKDKEES